MLRRKPCTVLVQGKHRRNAHYHRLPAGFPQKEAETPKESFGEIAEFSATDKDRYVPYDCKQDGFSSGPLKSQSILYRLAL